MLCFRMGQNKTFLTVQDQPNPCRKVTAWRSCPRVLNPSEFGISQVSSAAAETHARVTLAKASSRDEFALNFIVRDACSVHMFQSSTE